MAARPLCWGTRRSASSHHSDSCLSPPPALCTPTGPQKATFHQKCENVNQDAFMLFMMGYLWWQESRPAGLLGPFQTSAPVGHMKLILSNQLSITNSYTHTKTTYLQKHIPANSSECLKMNQLTRNISNRNSYSCIPSEKVLRYGQQKRYVNKYSVWKGSCYWCLASRDHWAWLKRHARSPVSRRGAMLSHFSGRCHLWELLFELSSQMWKPSTTNTQAAKGVKCFPKTHCINQWRMIFLFLLLIRLLSCFPSLTSLL